MRGLAATPPILKFFNSYPEYLDRFLAVSKISPNVYTASLLDPPNHTGNRAQ
jgi:hypothetical protein